jgi:hypothetical protein
MRRAFRVSKPPIHSYGSSKDHLSLIEEGIEMEEEISSGIFNPIRMIKSLHLTNKICSSTIFPLNRITALLFKENIQTQKFIQQIEL